jgi:membrane associated rhomboid family serine protease
MLISRFALYFWQSPNFESYQLVTSMFLHANFTHWFFNMFALWMFGRILEYDLGSRKFLTYYMVSGIGAGIIHLMVRFAEVKYLGMPFVDVPTIGASGAVFGILLSFGMLHPNNMIMLIFPPIPMKAKYFVIVYGVLELVLGVSYPGSGVAHFAHIGGMIFGFFLLRYWRAKGEIRFGRGRY